MNGLSVLVDPVSISIKELGLFGAGAGVTGGGGGSRGGSRGGGSGGTPLVGGRNGSGMGSGGHGLAGSGRGGSGSFGDTAAATGLPALPAVSADGSNGTPPLCAS